MLSGKCVRSIVSSTAVIVNLAFSGLVCIFAATTFLSVHFSWGIGLVAVGIIGSVYLINRLSDNTEDITNNFERIVFVVHRRVIIAVSAIIAGMTLGYGIAVYKMSPYELYLIGVGILYSFPIIPVGIHPVTKIRFIRLKEIPLMKNILVALLWSLSIFLLPILHADGIANVTVMVYLLIIAQIIATLTNTFDSDIEDAEGDRLAGVPTLPVMIGKKGTYMTIAGINIVWLITIGILYCFGIVRTHEFCFFLAMILWPVGVAVGKKSVIGKSKDIMAIAGDMQLLVYGGGMYVLTLFAR